MWRDRNYKYTNNVIDEEIVLTCIKTLWYCQMTSICILDTDVPDSINSHIYHALTTTTDTGTATVHTQTTTLPTDVFLSKLKTCDCTPGSNAGNISTGQKSVCWKVITSSAQFTIQRVKKHNHSFENNLSYAVIYFTLSELPSSDFNFVKITST